MAEKKETKPTTENKPVPKKRKPRQPKRSMEEIMNLPEKKLSDSEKIVLIRKLKEEIMLLTNKNNECHNIIDSSFEKTRMLEDECKSMEVYYTEQLKYINSQVNAFHAAINKATKGV